MIDVPLWLADAMTQWLRERSQSQRPPAAAGAQMALYVLLWERHEAVPTRAEIAGALGCSVPAVDKVRSKYRGDLLMERVGAVPGNAQGEVSTIKLSYMDPSEELVAAVRAARRRR